MGDEASPIRSQKQGKGGREKEREGAARKTYPKTFFGCCASAVTATASSVTAIRIDDRPAFFIAHPDFINHAEGNKQKVIYDGRRLRRGWVGMWVWGQT
jgi:hypothetical protein